METNTKYLVRPNDSHIFEIDPSNGAYRSKTTIVLYSDGTRPKVQPHYTFDFLTKNFGFIPIEEKDLQFYIQKGKEYMDYQRWASRTDGHDGRKGGTIEDFKNFRRSS